MVLLIKLRMPVSQVYFFTKLETLQLTLLLNILCKYIGQMIWSKLDSGRLPNLQEILSHFEENNFVSQP